MLFISAPVFLSVQAPSDEVEVASVFLHNAEQSPNHIVSENDSAGGSPAYFLGIMTGSRSVCMWHSGDVPSEEKSMPTRILWTKKIQILLIVSLILAAPSVAQEVAFFASLRGVVVLKKQGFETRSATLLDKLSVGDEIRTGGDGSATITFYTGKETRLGSIQTLVISKEENSLGFLGRVSRILTSLIWDSTDTRLATGGTRGGLNKKREIRALMPYDTQVYGGEITFTWNDSRSKLGTSYRLQIIKTPGALTRTIPLNNSKSSWVASPPSLGLERGGTYTWSIKDEDSKESSKERRFSFLSREDETRLTNDLDSLRSYLYNLKPGTKFQLLSAAVYWQYGLYSEVVRGLLPIVKSNPELIPGHELLAGAFEKLGMKEEFAATRDSILSIVKRTRH